MALMALCSDPTCRGCMRPVLVDGNVCGPCRDLDAQLRRWTTDDNARLRELSGRIAGPVYSQAALTIDRQIRPDEPLVINPPDDVNLQPGDELCLFDRELDFYRHFVIRPIGRSRRLMISPPQPWPGNRKPAEPPRRPE